MKYLCGFPEHKLSLSLLQLLDEDGKISQVSPCGIRMLGEEVLTSEAFVQLLC